MIPENIFRAYDIRGIFQEELTENVALKIGRAVSTLLKDESKDVIVGRDVRLSGEQLQNALIKGLQLGGCNVEDIGMVTTPALYFSSAHYGKDAGVMVTASHNPPNWNGFKIWRKDGFVCEGKGMEDLKRIVLSNSYKESGVGRVKRNAHALMSYSNHIVNSVKVERELKAVFDAGNGASSLLIPKTCEDAEIEVVALNAEPDGSFSRHPPEVTVEVLNELESVVLKEKAAFGVSFDGDGDRCVFVDDKGRVVPSNSIFIILAEHYLRKQKGAPIVYEISCSMLVEEVISSNGGKPILSRVGHAYIYENMIAENAVLGGESSGHYYFNELYGFDDGLFTSLKLAEILSRSDRHLSEMVDSIPVYPRISKNLNCPDEKKFCVVEKIQQQLSKSGDNIISIDGVKSITPKGWFLIRPSNTQPKIRLTVESKTYKDLETLTKAAEEKIASALKSISS